MPPSFNFPPSMTHRIKRTNTEINNVLDSAAAWEDHGGTSVSGMSYEQGVGAGIKWLIGDTDEHPLQEDPPEED